MNVPAKLPGETNREYAFRTISDNIISLNIEPGTMIGEVEDPEYPSAERLSRLHDRLRSYP